MEMSGFSHPTNPMAAIIVIRCFMGVILIMRKSMNVKRD